MTAEIIILPPVYLIAWKNGDVDDLVADYETRKRWEAEVVLFDLTERYPEIEFWITQRDLL